jgi:oligopeptide/dipeptide ABC transporter ATP-binding protein
MSSTPVLRGDSLSVTFRTKTGPLYALSDVSMEVQQGETVALVGESGSGKSTLANVLMRIHDTESGSVHYGEHDVTRLAPKEMRPHRRMVQMIMQDPYSSFDPHMSVGRIISEPLRVHKVLDRGALKERVNELITAVGLEPAMLGRLPSQFSGGQRQRIAIARALALNPQVIVADEPVSALDVSIQAQIVNLLMALQRDKGLAFLVIAHDLALVHHMADRVLVMYAGEIVESGPVDQVVTQPQHPYTAALLSASTTMDAEARMERIVLKGEPASARGRKPGCPFAPRCPVARPRCSTDKPQSEPSATGGTVACFYPGELPGMPLD